MLTDSPVVDASLSELAVTDAWLSEPWLMNPWSMESFLGGSWLEHSDPEDPATGPGPQRLLPSLRDPDLRR